MARFDCADWRPLPESGSQAKIRPTQVIFHTAVDAPGPTNLGGYFARADISLESHFWSPLAGRLQQLMDTEERADANRFANRRVDGTGAISVETEDEGNPEGLPWNAKQLDDLVAVGVEAHVRHGIPVRLCGSPSDPGFGWHSMWGAPSAWTPSAGKTCPGSTRIAQIPEVMRRIAAVVDGTGVFMALSDNQQDQLFAMVEAMWSKNWAAPGGDLSWLKDTVTDVVVAALAALPAITADVTAEDIKAAVKEALREGVD